jgi:hypothetical protein
MGRRGVLHISSPKKGRGAIIKKRFSDAPFVLYDF